MKRFLTAMALSAILPFFACKFDRIVTSSVLVICVIDNDTLRINPETGMVINTDLTCADVADSLSIVVP